MFLKSLTHRDRLFDIATDWLEGHVGPDDGRFITTVFLLENAITMPSVAGILTRACGVREGGEIRLRRVRTKEQVRRSIIDGWRTPTDRARALFETFEQLPESFYPSTPVDVTVATGADAEMLAMVRLKSPWRVADKVARRATERIRRELGAKLRRGAGTGSTWRAPDPASGLDEAERAFQEGRTRFTKEDLVVQDVLGAKLILSEDGFDRAERALATHPDVLSVQRSEHVGTYNDVQLLVEVRRPPATPTIERLLAEDWSVAERRGIPARDLLDAIPEYVETGADSFTLEILLTTWPELVESEFGRGLHEERIVRQRMDPLWTGRVATNVLLTSLSILLLAVAPTVHIEKPPARLSGRSLPETALGVLAQLFQLEVGRSALWVPPSNLTRVHG